MLRFIPTFALAAFVACPLPAQEPPVPGLVGSVILPTGPQAPEQPAAKGPAKVEFFWVEAKPVEGLTQAKGLQTSCDPDELVYVHLKPVLTAKDVAGTRMSNSDLSKNGLPGDHFMINFELTKEAKGKLIAGCVDAGARSLVVVADGTYWGLSYFRKADAATFSPHAGFISSRATAERIVSACQPVK
ncbi:MAG TPA: hypothetical protein VFB80_21815 [Pirellulaceae bacterium]|nr:hypothetical protein [Pirellulaceae bacterium]